MSLLELDITRKGQINELFPESEPEFDNGDNMDHKLEVIKNSVVSAKKADGYLSGLYNLVFWKSYLEEKNTGEPSSTIMHNRKMIFTFHKDHPEKPTGISPLFDSTLPIAKPSVKPIKTSTK